MWAALALPRRGRRARLGARGYEFVDWGGGDHVGGGSHGSLRRGDSLGPLAFLNCGPDAGRLGGRLAAVVDHRRAPGSCWTTSASRR